MQLKKLVSITLLFAIASIKLHADTTTPRLHLTIPTIGSPTWGQKINQNFQILDSTVNTGGGGAGIPGGSPGQFQWNCAGLFCGSSDLTTSGTGITVTQEIVSTLTVTSQTTFQSVASMTIQLSTMTFNTGTDLQLLYVSPSSVLSTDASGNVVTTGISFVQLNPAATQTGNFSITAGTVTTTFTAGGVRIVGNVAAPVQLRGPVEITGGGYLAFDENGGAGYVTLENIGNRLSINGSAAGGLVTNSTITAGGALFVNKGLSWGGLVTVNSNTTLTVANSIVLGSATISAPTTLILPAASAMIGQQITIKKVDASTQPVVIQRAGADLIESTTTIYLYAQYQTQTLVSDGVSLWLAPNGISHTPTYAGPAQNMGTAIAAVGVSSTAYYTAFNLQDYCAMTGVRLSNGVVSGNVDVGIYDQNFNRLKSNGGTTTIANRNTYTFASPVQLIPGQYWIAMSPSDATATWIRQGSQVGVGNFSKITSFPLPATLTGGSEASLGFVMEGICAGGQQQ